MKISDKCIHKNLDQKFTKRVIEQITSELLAVVSGRIVRKLKRQAKKYNLSGIVGLLNYLVSALTTSSS